MRNVNSILYDLFLGAREHFPNSLYSSTASCAAAISLPVVTVTPFPSTQFYHYLMKTN